MVNVQHGSSMIHSFQQKILRTKKSTYASEGAVSFIPAGCLTVLGFNCAAQACSHGTSAKCHMTTNIN